MAGGIGGLASSLGKLALKNAPSSTPSGGPRNGGGAAGPNPGTQSMSAAQFANVAGKAANVTQSALSNDHSGVPDIGDPAYSPPNDVPSALYS